MTPSHPYGPTTEWVVETRAPVAEGAALAVSFYGLDGVRSVRLEPSKQMTVGRADDCDVRLTDPGISRQHSAFTHEGDTVKVEDLGSRNGTRLRGERVAEANVGIGEAVGMGSVVAVIVPATEASDSSQLAGYDALVDQLQLELRRAKTFGRPLSLITLRAAGGPGDIRHVAHWGPLVRTRLRPVDTVGLYGPRTILMLLPEVDGASAKAMMEELCVSLGDRQTLHAGIATFPAAATSAGGLVGAAREALHGATDKAPVQLADQTTNDEASDGEGLVIESPCMHELYELVRRVGRIDAPVLVLGETGCGKEHVVRALHDASPRSGGPLKAINCASIPEALLESLLFGHEKGAFTGATSTSRGFFESASGGTLFLDEIGELSKAAQAALLRALETKKITRVGSNSEIEVDVRIVAATHKPLDKLAATGQFRADLYHRLSTVVLNVAPLRERPEELIPLAEHFLAGARRAWGVTAHSFDEEALNCLQRYSWPGNVRELRNAVERAAAVCLSTQIRSEELPESVRSPGSNVLATPAPAPQFSADRGLKEHVADLEAKLIAQALAETGGNRARAAELLQVSRNTLRSKIQAYGLGASDTD